MSELPEALITLRATALLRIAHASGVHTDETTVRLLAERFSDRDVMAELHRRQPRPPWWRSLFSQRGTG